MVAFMDVAVGAIGIGVVVMVGYLVVSQVQGALPTPTFPNGSTDQDTLDDIQSAKTTVYAGFALVVVGIIVLAAFGLISVFR